MIQLKANQFFNDETELSQEASTLQLPPGTDMTQDIIVTTDNNRKLVFKFSHTEPMDGGGDIGEWSYKPVDTDIKIKVLTIWND